MVKRKTIECVCKTDKQKNHEENRVRYLPEDIIMNILCRCSAQFLYDVGRLVCKCWAMIISTPNFIHTQTQLFHSNANGFLFYVYASYCVRDGDDIPCIYVEQKGGKFFNSTFFEKRFGDFLFDGSSGCLLVPSENSLKIINPVTRQVTTVPWFLKENIEASDVKMAYIYLTGELKLVMCNAYVKNFETYDYDTDWSVLTVDSSGMSWWRTLNDSAALLKAPQFGLFNWSFSISESNVVVYCSKLEWYKSGSFFALDLHNECFHMLHAPPSCDEESVPQLIPMDRQLYVTSVKEGQSIMRIRIWKMIDFHQSEWAIIFAYVGWTRDGKPF